MGGVRKVAATEAVGKFDALLSSVRARWSYRDLTTLFKMEGLGTATGWEAMLTQLNEADATTSEKAERLLKGLNSDLALAGTKDVHIFDGLSPDDRVKLEASLGVITPPTSSRYCSTFPLSLGETELASMSSDHGLAGLVRRVNGDVSLVLCARRSAEERMHYRYSEVTDAVRTAFTDFDEFITVKKTNYQVFDVLTFRPRLARIEVLIDQPGMIRGPETSESRCLAILGRAMTLIPALQSIYDANKPLNLFPCISSIYHKSGEGRVSKLSFRSPTDSTKRETMTSQKDLRTEKFHAAGVKAVGDITPYDITVIWDSLSSNIASGTGVQIGMPITGLASEGSLVRSARILNARSDLAVLSIVNKLVSYST